MFMMYVLMLLNYVIIVLNDVVVVMMDGFGGVVLMCELIEEVVVFW